jgi:hypothetical protein
VVGGAEGLHAFAFELRGDRGEVDARVAGVGQDLLCRRRALAEHPGRLTVVGEGAQGGLGHGVDDAGGNQLLDVEDVGVGGVLGTGAGPQRALWMGAHGGQRPPALVGEPVAVAAVGEMGVGDRQPAAQRRLGGQQRVGLGVDA